MKNSSSSTFGALFENKDLETVAMNLADSIDDDRCLLLWKYVQNKSVRLWLGYTALKRYKNKNIIIITSKESRIDQVDDD